MEDINCPYCNSGQYINHDDVYVFDKNETHQQQCGECNKHFIFTTSISYHYSAKKADCLNDGKHDFKSTITYPVEFTYMRCVMCDDERKPTESEMFKILNKNYEKSKI